MSGASRRGAWDPTWEKVFREQEWGRYPSEEVVRFVARGWFAAPDRSEVTLLDLGSGPGSTTWFAAREGFNVCAVDGSTTAIQRLGERLAREGLAADARVADITSLPWPDETFDGVIDNACIYANRYDDCKRIVADVRRVMKPGGRLFSASFTDRTWGVESGREIEPGGFVDIQEGPLAGKGFSLMMDRRRIDDLFGGFSSKSVERVSRTIDSEKHLIEMWLVTCAK